MRLTAAPCQQLRYGLTEGGTVAIDAPDAEETSAATARCDAAMPTRRMLARADEGIE